MPAHAPIGPGDVTEDRARLRAARWNLAAAFLILFSVIGIPAIMVPVLYGSIIDDTGWSRGDVAMLSSIKFAFGAVACFATGWVVERWGVRRVTLSCAAMAALALVLLTLVHSLMMFYVVGALLGISALGTATGMKIFISQWFTRRQGMAVGAALTGTSVAGVVVPLVVTWLNAQFGWRETAAIMSLGIWLVAIPFFALFARELPGAVRAKDAPPLAEEAEQPTFRDVRTMRTFWVLLVVNVLMGMVDHGMVAHIVIHFDRGLGLGAQAAAFLLSCTMVMSNGGKIGWGWSFDRFSKLGVATCWFVAGVGILLLIATSGMTAAVLFALVYGSCQGGMLINMAVMAKKMFGTRSLAKSIAVVGACFNLGASIGPALLGYLYDAHGDYRMGFGIMAAASFTAGILTLALRPHRGVATAPERRDRPPVVEALPLQGA